MKEDLFRDANFDEIFKEINLDERLQQFAQKPIEPGSREFCEALLERYDRLAEINRKSLEELKARADAAIAAQVQPELPPEGKIGMVEGGLYLWAAFCGITLGLFGLDD